MTAAHLYLNTAEVADELRKSTEWVARQCKAGNLPAKKLGNDWRINRDALDQFMAAPDAVPTPRPGRTARQRRRVA